MKRMLINATQKEECRVALVDGQKLFELNIETPENHQKKANIYKGKITKINPSLEAAFVSYGGERDGFLALKEISKEYFPKDYVINGRPNIKDVVYPGQEIIVQIDKDVRGSKGAALTTFISLAGSYLVLMPNNPRSSGISRRVESTKRMEVKAIMSSLSIPKNMSVIVRTAGLSKSEKELAGDLNTLLCYWNAIQHEASTRTAPALIHQESDVITRSFRDHLRDDIGEILIDDRRTLEIAKRRLAALNRSEYLNKLKFYSGEIPLFNHFQIESQIESAFEREVRLPSGGSIVIDTTEALTSIDINSAKSTRGNDIEETAFSTNIEAVDEIAKQLRLRDLGGLIVIDFIDMTPIRNQREVEDRLKEAIKSDRARIQMTKISRFGLLELSRQRLNPSLRESNHHSCPRCNGTGIIRDNNSLSLSILRLIGEEAIKEKTKQIQVIVPLEIASYLLNEKRAEISKLEQENKISIVIAADSQMETPHYKVIRKKPGEELKMLSYNLPKIIRDAEIEDEDPDEIIEQTAALSGIETIENEKPFLVPDAKVEEKNNHTSGIFTRVIYSLKNLFSKSDEHTEKTEKEKTKQKNKKPPVISPEFSTKKPSRNKKRNNIAVSNKKVQENQEKLSDKNIQTQNQKIVKDKPIIAKTKLVKNSEKITQTKREKRNLSHSVRTIPETKIEQQNIQEKDSTKILTIAPEIKENISENILQNQIESKELLFENNNADKKQEIRRSRRSPRHLRLTGQRRRETQSLTNPNTFSLALYSPELAMGKIVSQFNSNKNHLKNNNKQIKPNKNSIEEKPIVISLNETIDFVQPKKIINELVQNLNQPIEEPQMKEQKSTNEILLLQNKNEDNSIKKPEKLIGFSSAPVSKTKNIFDYLHIDPINEDSLKLTEPKNENWERNVYCFSGKGASGAHSATSRTYSEMQKPN